MGERFLVCGRYADDVARGDRSALSPTLRVS